MSAVLWEALVILALGLGLAFVMDRRLAREQREREWRAWLKVSPAARRMAANFDAMKEQIGTALVPAIQRMAVALSALSEAARAAMSKEAER